MMVVKGIIRRHLPAANPVRCMIEEDAVAEMARTNGITRSMAAVDCWKPDLAGSVVVIGNAPPALFRLLELMEEGANPPALILGFPVGLLVLQNRNRPCLRKPPERIFPSSPFLEDVVEARLLPQH